MVVDPVMVAKSGDRLLKADAIDALVSQLLPVVLIITPNLQEAEVLTGMRVECADDMKCAAVKLKEFGPKYVLIKGGHLPGNPVDLLWDGRNFREYAGVRHQTPHTHGTGCTLASAIAAFLARGSSVEDAVARAKAYVTGAIAKGLPLGLGHGPVHHFHEFYGFN